MVGARQQTQPEARHPCTAAVPAQVELSVLDREVLAFWARADVFARSVRATLEGPAWTFYEGPPTANGMPGTHHVEGAGVPRDVFPRFKTMKGFHVHRKAVGTATGCPSSLAVEKELGFSGKGDRGLRVAEFNARAGRSVQSSYCHLCFLQTTHRHY